MDKDFGAYELRDRIGKGGMAWVYLANQKNLDRLVALKILFPHLAEDATLVERFKLEARSAAAMRHENVAQVYDFGSYGEQFYIAMEYVEGLNLRDWIDRKGAPPLEIALLMLRDICRGLEHAHRRGIIHRDIKPSNVMFTPDGVIKLMDFGLARRVEDRSGITLHGAMLGTPAYMSPEQARGEKLDRPTTDIFSLGIVCYELLGGLKPFQGDSSSVARSILYEEPRPLDVLDPLVPPVVEAMIRRMLEKNADVRVQTVGEARNAFDTGIAELGVTHDRELLGDFAADPVQVSAVLRAKRLAWHLERVRAAEARGDAMATLREHRCVAFLDPSNHESAEYVKAHDVPEPMRRTPPPVMDIENTVLMTPEDRAASHFPAPPEATTLPPRSRPGVAPPPTSPPSSAAPAPLAPPAPGGSRPGVSPEPSRGDSKPPGIPAPPGESRPGVAPSRGDSKPPTVPPAPRPTPAPAARPPSAPMPSPASSRPPAPKPAPPAPSPKPVAASNGGARRGGPPVALFALAGALLVAIVAIVLWMMRPHGVVAPPGATTDTTSPATPQTETEPPVATPEVAALTVTVEPEGARVVLDQQEPQPAPARFNDLTPGKHTVQVLRDSFMTARRVVVLSGGKDSTLVVKLKPAGSDHGRVEALYVTVAPSDAQVTLDGEKSQVGNATFRAVTAGEHTLEVRRSGFMTATQAFSVRAQPETTLVVTLRPEKHESHNVTVRTSPAGGQVSIDEGSPKRDPARFDGVAAGPHRVRASLPGSDDAIANFTFSGLRDTTLSLRLTRSAGQQVSGPTGTLLVWMHPAGNVLVDRVVKYSNVESVTVVLPAGRDFQIGLQPNWAGSFVSQPVRVGVGQSKPFGYDFRHELMRVDVTVTGGDGSAEIVLDGKPTGIFAPNSIYCGSGNHKFRVQVEGWKAREGQQAVKLKAGQSRAITFTLERP